MPFGIVFARANRRLSESRRADSPCIAKSIAELAAKVWMTTAVRRFLRRYRPMSIADTKKMTALVKSIRSANWRGSTHWKRSKLEWVGVGVGVATGEGGRWSGLELDSGLGMVGLTGGE